MSNDSRIDKLEQAIDYLRVCFNKVDARFDMISEEARVLTNRVHELESNGTKYGKPNQSSLEERTELRLSDITADSGPYAAFEAQQAAYRKYFDGLEAESMGCQGDMLGQCEHGCDGISDRGSCIEIEIVAAQCGRCVEHCDVCTHDEWYGKLVAPLCDDTLACKYEVSTAQCGRPYESCDTCSPAMHEAMSMPACKQGERACKYELSDADSCDYSNKPRREPVDNDDAKYGVVDLKGLGGSTGRRVGEHKANMSDNRSYRAWMASDEAFEAELQRMYADDIDDIASTVRWVPGFGLMDQATLDRFNGLDITTSNSSAAPAQVVYCCNGAMYEAR